MTRQIGCLVSKHLLLAALLAVQAATCAAPAPGRGETQLFEALPSVFAASRFDQPLSDAPSSVSVITAADIRRYGYRTLADILGGARGIFSTNDRNYSYVGVRGFARSGDYNSRLLVLIDGHRINDNVYGTASLGAEAPIDVSLIERVEIIRGPTSSLYGANAIFGTVNVIIRRGRDLQGSSLDLGLGSQASRAGRYASGRRLPSGLEYLVSASSYSTQGESRIRFPEFDAPATNNGIAEKRDAERARRLFAKFQFEDFGLTAALSERTKSIPTAAFGTVFNDPGNRTTDEQMFVELRHRADVRGGDLRSRVYYDNYNYYGDYTYNLPPWSLNKDSASGKWWGGELTWSGNLAPAHRVTLGTEYRQNIEMRQRNYDAAINLDDKRRDHTWGAFLQDEWRLSPAWLANLGVRYDHHGSQGGRTSPRAALNFRPREQSTLKLIYGQAFRPPNAYESFYNDGNVTQKSNTSLRVETIRTSELVWEERFSPRWRGSAGLYRYRIDGLVTQRTDPADGLLVFVNQNALTARGVEFELEGRFNNGAEALLSIANQGTRDEDTGTGLTNSPRNMLKSRLLLPLAPDRWYAGIELNYLDARRTLAGATNAPYWLANLTITADRPMPGVRLSLSLNNLFNQRYSDPGGPEHTQDRIPQAGRTIFGRVEFQF